MDFITSRIVPYQEALKAMERRVEDIISGKKDELVWFLEHPPLYTGGTSSDLSEITNPENLPVYNTGRGGKYTYHGPGQRIAYVMLNLKERTAEDAQPDLRSYVWMLQEWLIRTLEQLNVRGERRSGRIGIWVPTDDGKEEKIAALGIRIRKWVTYHGIALNIKPNMQHFKGIVPCGINEYGVTSLEKLGIDVSMEEVDRILKQEFDKLFGDDKSSTSDESDRLRALGT